MEDIKSLKKLASKRFGQNFLKDRIVLKKIIEAIPKDSLKIAEIGSGLGDLTKELLDITDITAFEVDTRLCKILNSTFEYEIQSKKLKLNCEDVLNYWKQNGSLSNEKYHLVANLPYYIATNIILKAFRDDLCQNILVMVQKEVAEKFSAKCGNKDFSALSVLTGIVGEGKILFDVNPNSFVPPPKVTSSILFIKKRDSFKDDKFEEFLKIAFKQPRKKLLKNLSLKYKKEYLQQIFDEMDINQNIRPHQTEISVYQKLYKKLSEDITDGREQQKKSRRTKGEREDKKV